jgi:hypothetical protein
VQCTPELLPLLIRLACLVCVHPAPCKHQQVTVEGFGPFASPVTYPLSGRGVVAVTGANRDDAAAVSNGSG